MNQIGTILIPLRKGTRQIVEIHQVFDAGLGNNAFLHRFLNGANVEYSAIYQDGEEIWSCERGHEADMLKSWKESEIH